MHSSRNASRLASAGLALILLFLSGFALWGATTTDRSAADVKRASVVSDGFRLARYSLALEDLVMTTYLTLPLYEKVKIVPPDNAWSTAPMSMGGASPMKAPSMRPSTPVGKHTGASPVRRRRAAMSAVAMVPRARAMAASSMQRPWGATPEPAAERAAERNVPGARPVSSSPAGMSPAPVAASMVVPPVHAAPVKALAKVPATVPATSLESDVAGAQALGGITGGQLPSGPILRASHESASTQLMQSMQDVMLNGSPADRRLANDVLTRHAQHMAYAMRMFQAVDQRHTGQALWIEQHQLGPSFSHIEKEVDRAAATHRADSLRRLQDLSNTESLVFGGTIIAFAVGLVLLGGLAALLRSYARRIEETRMIELARLEKVALTDNLTGLRNHRAFQEDLARQLELRNRTGVEFCLLLLDLDGLKQVNDRYGHQKGDEQLTELALALNRTVRDQDVAYRIGGDEYAVLLPGGNAWAGMRLMERLNLELMASRVSPRPSATAGIAESRGGDAKDIVIKHADLALIEAKTSDRPAMVYSEGLAREMPSGGHEHQQEHLTMLTTALARAVDAKDSYTRSHSDTVSELCGLIATHLGLPPEHRARVRLAGLLHDVGKIGIADEILKKAARLTAAEFEIMKTHSTLGHTIVSGAAMEREAHWILHHHERVDGTGYPDGLKGDEVPLESRIILVADAFEAMTSDRPYRKGRPEAEAFEELERHAGSQFDPACVGALRRALAPQDTRAAPAPGPAPMLAPLRVGVPAPA